MKVYIVWYKNPGLDNRDDEAILDGVFATEKDAQSYIDDEVAEMADEWDDEEDCYGNEWCEYYYIDVHEVIGAEEKAVAK